MLLMLSESTDPKSSWPPEGHRTPFLNMTHRSGTRSPSYCGLCRVAVCEALLELLAISTDTFGPLGDQARPEPLGLTHSHGTQGDIAVTWPQL